jgi:glycosyltransferase involved in cell wall biosynthesis
MILSVVIPAYNEAERIAPTIRQFHDWLSAKKMQFEILVADDGSTDNTLAVVTAMQHHLPSLSVLALPGNRGKGNAVRQGMLAAKGDIRVFTDADGSTPARDLDKLLQPLLDGLADIAIGSRYLATSQVLKAQPKFRVVWSRLTNKLVQRMLLPGIVDPHCGFKAFTAEAAQQVFNECNIDGWSFDLEALSIARKQNLKITEVPVQWANDERSKGKLSHLPRELYSFYKIKKQLAL